MSWTDERVESLKKLWLDGLSASQIAKHLGGGLTRNAVIGKVHRLGLSGRASPSQPRPAFKPVRPPRMATPATPPARRAEPIAAAPMRADPIPVSAFEETGSATVLTLGAHMCKWPIGDPSRDGFAFCGRASGKDGPYCAHHAQVAYQPQAKKTARRPEPTELVRSLRRYV